MYGSDDDSNIFEESGFSMSNDATGMSDFHSFNNNDLLEIVVMKANLRTPKCG